MISVCLASYNGEKYIKEQINSILPQLSQNDELIVSDDRSSDRTLEIVSSFNDHRIKVIINKNDSGYSKNFENALNYVKGDIIFICDQDDVWMPDKVNIMRAALKESWLAIHDAEIVDGELNTINKSHFTLYNVQGGFWINFLKTRYIGACMAFRAELLERVLPLPSNQKLCAYDYWITIVAERYYTVKRVTVPLIKYRRHGDNASSGGAESLNSNLKKLKVRAYCLYHLITLSLI